MLAPGQIPVKYKLTKKFKDELLKKPINWGFKGLSEFTFYRTYSRTKENGTLETWGDCVIRVVEGMFSLLKTYCITSHLPWSEKRAHKLAEEAAERLFCFKWTPPGRGLWMMGTDYMWERGAMALYNCAFVSTQDIDSDLSKPFAFVMDVLMQGVGSGFDTLGAEKIIIRKPEGDPEIITVDDTREGWVEAISCLLDSYFEENSNPIFINTELVRGYGEPIKGFGGVASGPEPLIQGFNGIKYILNRRNNELLQSTDIVDIMNIIGKVVVAGNVRRSALLSLGSSNDINYMELKNYNKYAVELGMVAPQELKEISETEYNLYNSNFKARKQITDKYKDKSWAFKFGGWRWSSNNSIYGKKSMDYSSIAKNIALNGEPGIFWIENARNYGRLKDGITTDDRDIMGANPCVEIALNHMETCNLNENYPVKHEDYWDFQRTLKFSYLYSKAVTLLATNWEDTNAVIVKNRRIGCSISGIQEAFIKFGRSEFLDWTDKAYDYITYVDRKYSDWLGIPKSIRRTTVKPSGTVSLLAGSLPGIHHPESTSYYRTVRVSNTSDLIPILKDCGYKIEPAASDPSRTVVVYFGILHDEDHVAKDKISIWRQFKDVADIQKNYCDNMVSVTITFKQNEAEQIADCLSAFEAELKSVSLLPLSEHGYEQAPYMAAPRKEIEDYLAKLKPLDFSNLTSEGENVESNKYCTNDSCELF